MKLTCHAGILSLLVIVSTSQGQTLSEKLGEFLARTPHPQAVENFSPLFHLASKNQDTTLVCWSFSTTSFLETEMQRLGMTPIPLARMYPVYCVFLEKAKQYIKTRGRSRFSPGDLFTGVLETIAKYGIVPEEAYRGQAHVRERYNHSELYAELSALMKRVKNEEMWDEDRVLELVRPILDKHLGAPPTEFTYNGRTYTPLQFYREVVRLPWDQYVLVTSFMYAPYYSYAELKVPDNWKHHDRYFNVPLDVFYLSIKDAVTGGFSLAIDADISELSYTSTKEFGIVPDFDIPTSLISQEAREFRFANGSTTDDHLMQIIGFKEFGNEEWFLVKDSWRTAFEGPLNGYFFFHESYVKLKVLAFLVHRDGVPSITSRLTER